MASGEQPVSVVDNSEEHRFEVRVGVALAGFASYRAAPGRLTVFHTEIDPAFEGRGLGGRLAAGLLDDIRARGLTVTPICPFIAAYIERHPEYEDIVDAES